MFPAATVAYAISGAMCLALQQEPKAQALGATTAASASETEDWQLQSMNYDFEGWLTATGQLQDGKLVSMQTVRDTEYMNASSYSHEHAGAIDNLCINGRLAPEFFLIGAQKASTSSFSAEFFYAPAVVHPMFFAETHDGFPSMHMKELHIFDEKVRYGRGQSWWLRHYPACSKTKKMVGVDMTPNYLLEPKAPGRMRAWYGHQSPRLSFMVLLRDPVYRMQSAFYHGRAVNWCDGEYAGVTFRQYSERFVADYHASPEQAWDRWSSQCTAVRGSAYAQQIKLWFETFSSKQFTIVPMAFQSDRSLTPYGQQSVAQTMFERLGIHGGATTTEDVNVHPHPKLEDDLPLWLLEKLQRAVYRHTGPKIVATLLSTSKAFLYGLNAASRTIPSITDWLHQHW